MTDQSRSRTHDDLTIDDDLQAAEDEVLASIWSGWGGSSEQETQRQQEQATVDPVARFKDRLRQGARERSGRPRDE